MRTNACWFTVPRGRVSETIANILVADVRLLPRPISRKRPSCHRPAAVPSGLAQVGLFSKIASLLDGEGAETNGCFSLEAHFCRVEVIREAPSQPQGISLQLLITPR